MEPLSVGGRIRGRRRVLQPVRAWTSPDSRTAGAADDVMEDRAIRDSRFIQLSAGRNFRLRIVWGRWRISVRSGWHWGRHGHHRERLRRPLWNVGVQSVGNVGRGATHHQRGRGGRSGKSYAPVVCNGGGIIRLGAFHRQQLTEPDQQPPVWWASGLQLLDQRQGPDRDYGWVHGIRVPGRGRSRQRSYRGRSADVRTQDLGPDGSGDGSRTSVDTN